MTMQSDRSPLTADGPAQPDAVQGDARSRRQRALADILNVAALQEIQDGYTAVTGLEAQFIDAEGLPVTQPSVCERLTERREALLRELEGPLNRRFEAPIEAEGERLGAIVLTGQVMDETCRQHLAEAEALADRFAIEPDHRDEFVNAIQHVGASRQSEAVRFVYLLADAVAEVCRQDIEQAQRADELGTLYRLSTLLAEKRDLQQVLDTVAREAASVLEAKAASIRLLDAGGRELLPQAVYNLSREYLDKGPILLERSRIDQRALEGEVVYVPDMATDERTLYPDDARREGLASILSAGLSYRGKKIGVIRIYSAERRTFSAFERHLLNAIGQLAAAAIDNVRLARERREAQRVQRQVELAADVQRRLLPAGPPASDAFEVAGRYEPCFELGGDFYDFLQFEETLGIIVGDVVGKGVAASLLMATVRAALRAHAEDTYDLDSIMAKVNAGLARDTGDNEFATVFYGTFDARTFRLTYASAGHEPALLLRDGRFIELSEGGMVLGVDPRAWYEKGLIDLLPGDILLAYTDGVMDATNFNDEKFGRDRIRRAMLYAADGSAQDIVNHILWEVRRFVGLNRAADDMTLVAAKVKRPAGA